MYFFFPFGWREGEGVHSSSLLFLAGVRNILGTVLGDTKFFGSFFKYTPTHIAHTLGPLTDVVDTVGVYEVALNVVAR